MKRFEHELLRVTYVCCNYE